MADDGHHHPMDYENARIVAEHDARQRKVERILFAIARRNSSPFAADGAMVTADIVERCFTDDTWAALERLAGVRPCSAATRELVVRALRRVETRTARGAEDPFAGLPS